jgi:kynurenine formamidase
LRFTELPHGYIVRRLATLQMLRRIDLSPADFVHVPQAPRIVRTVILTRDEANPWQMRGVTGVDGRGAPVGLSNHTWSHVDAPFHRLPDGTTLDAIPPPHYLASRARVVDLSSSTASARRERIDDVEYHSAIDVEDLPGDLEGCEAILFVTGFGPLIERGYPMTAAADEHYPSLTEAAACRLAGIASLRLVALDSPTIDKPQADGIAHVVLLGRQPAPVLLVESLTCERLRRAVSTLPRDVLLTVEPLRAFGPSPDGALASVYAYCADPGSEVELDRLATLMIEATRAGAFEFRESPAKAGPYVRQGEGPAQAGPYVRTGPIRS